MIKFLGITQNLVVAPNVQFEFPNGYIVSVVQLKFPSGNLHCDVLVFHKYRENEESIECVDAVKLTEILSEVSKRTS